MLLQTPFTVGGVWIIKTFPFDLKRLFNQPHGSGEGFSPPFHMIVKCLTTEPHFHGWAPIFVLAANEYVFLQKNQNRLYLPRKLAQLEFTMAGRCTR